MKEKLSTTNKQNVTIFKNPSSRSCAVQFVILLPVLIEYILFILVGFQSSIIVKLKTERPSKTFGFLLF